MSDALLTSAPNWDHEALNDYVAGGLLVRAASLERIEPLCRGALCYLATPYSKIAVDDDGVWDSEASFEAGMRAARWAARLAAVGITAISPVSQSVEMVGIGVTSDLDPLDAAFWERWCRPLLSACDCVIVPPIDGWRESDGIWHEVCMAFASVKPVILIDRGALLWE